MKTTFSETLTADDVPTKKLNLIIPPPAEHENHPVGATAQERLDEAMAESFPASDPPSWTAGIKHKEDELTEDSSA